jgi:ACDE family multidrug resistance protein
MRWRRPEGLLVLEPSVGTDLARLTGLEGFARSVMTGVVPLAAFEALGSKAAVSYVFIGGAVITVLFTLNVGALERRFQRRWVVSLAAGFLLLAAALLAFADGPLFAIAIGLRSAEASIFSVCLSLYIMDFIGKRDLTVIESRRIIYSGMAWLGGPLLGVWLWGRGHTVAPFGISGLATIVMISYFWRLRFHHNAVLMTPTSTITNPFANVARFFRQRNLRIAYAITLSRAVFWAALFVYGPIYIVEADLPTWTAGAFLSLASSMLFFSPVIRRTADRFGSRGVIIAAFTLMATSMSALALLAHPEPLGVVFWLLGALGGAALDVLGNIPFMRMVKPRERTAMTTVFSTWREVSFLIAPLIAALALAAGSFRILYVTIAAILAGAAVATSFLPRRI